MRQVRIAFPRQPLPLAGCAARLLPFLFPELTAARRCRKSGGAAIEPDLFERQFVLARRAFGPQESWRHIPLPAGWVLSAHRALPVDIEDDGSPQRRRLVLGHRYCVDPARRRGSGRYAALDWPLVRNDPVGLMALFYSGTGNDLVVASHPALALKSRLGTIPPYDITHPLQHRHPINFIPAPATRWNAVRRTFCDQAIDLDAGAVVHADHGIRPMASFEAARDAVAEELCRFAEEARRRISGTVFLPLTAGLDSRTVAAAFLATGLPFEAVTLRFVGKPATDATVARRISRAFGLRHHAMALNKPDPARRDRFAAQVSDAFEDWTLTHTFPGDAYRYQQPGDAMIVAGCFEIGRQHSFPKALGDLDLATASGAGIWARVNGVASGPTALTDALDEWKAWRCAHPEGLDWLAALYLDQRLTAWRATIELGYDLLPAVVLHPANHVRILSGMITPDAADQGDGRLQRAVIERLEPRLLDFPINPPSLEQRLRWLRGRWRRRSLRLAGLLTGGWTGGR